MDFLCFNVKENKYAIQINNLYKILNNYNLTFFNNIINKPIYLIKNLDNLIPIFDINNTFNNENRLILILLNNNNIFGIFIDEIGSIVRDKLPFGYMLISTDVLENMCLNINASVNDDIELF